MLTTALRAFGLATLGAILLIASATSALANSSVRSEGGCTGLGSTWIDNASYAYSSTSTSFYGGCGWVFSQATFYSSGIGYIVGPGWMNSSFAISEFFNSTTSVSGYHKLCNAGGPCGSSTGWGTSDVP